MDETLGKDARIGKLLAAALDGRLTDAQAEELAALDRRLGRLAWLAVSHERGSPIDHHQPGLCLSEHRDGDLSGRDAF